jgi:hypothetical protein
MATPYNPDYQDEFGSHGEDVSKFPTNHNIIPTASMLAFLLNIFKQSFFSFQFMRLMYELLSCTIFTKGANVTMNATLAPNVIRL